MPLIFLCQTISSACEQGHKLTPNQPCTARDFMNYLIYIEHAAENLQFFLWHRDYLHRFNNLASSERTLAPIWTPEQADADNNQAGTAAKQQISAETAAAFKGTDFATPTVNIKEVKGNPFNTPPRTPNGDNQSVAPSDVAWSENGSTLNVSHTPGVSHQKQAADAFERADVKWQPCE